MPEFEYNFVQTGPTDDNGMPTEPAYIGGGMFQRQADLGMPIITIDVDDMTKALATIAEHGGAAVGEPQQVGDMGIAAYFTDSEGNLMGLWQSQQARASELPRVCCRHDRHPSGRPANHWRGHVGR